MFSYEEGNPFIVKIGMKKYFVFLKNLSPAYLVNSPDVTRVQLPYSPHFSEIFKANIPFITLGYDANTDTVVSWNPTRVKDRLNVRNNVSLYSRSSIQNKVNDNEFRFGYLSNGEKIVLFKLKNLIYFFDVALSLFKVDYQIDTIHVSNKIIQLSDRERFVLWLHEKYSKNTVKHYNSGLNKISKDLKEISELKSSLFEIRKPYILQKLYNKWYSVRKFRTQDIIGKYMYSNSFKRFIEFREYEQKSKLKTLTKTSIKTKSAKEKDITEKVSKITDKELLQTLKPLLKKNQVLQAVEITSKHYGKKHKNMTFKDWYKIVSDIYIKMNT
jgi:hypothetical protein